MRPLIRLLTPLVLLMAMLLPAGGATAAPATTVHSEHFSIEFNNCNGDIIEVRGFVHIVVQVQEDGSQMFHQTVNAQGVSERGNEYVFNHIVKARSSADDFSFDQRLRLTSKGSEPNQLIITHFGSDGFSADLECQG